MEFKLNEIKELAKQNIQNIDLYVANYDKSIENDKNKLEKMHQMKKQTK